MSEQTSKPESTKKPRPKWTKKPVSNGNGHMDFEEVKPSPDPLADLIARATKESKVAHLTETVMALHALRKVDRARFVELFNALKLVKGVSIGDLREQLAELDTTSTDLGFGEESAADVLLRLAAPAKLFVAEGTREPFADIEIEGVRHTYHLEDLGFSDWLIGRYLDATQKAPSQEALKVVLTTLAAQARLRSPRHPVFSRIGHTDGMRFMDRGTEDRSVIEISSAGVRLIATADCPVRFIRPADGMGELPIPEPGGSIDDLKPFFNLRDDDHFVLAVAWMLGCFLIIGAYLIELLMGEHGSGKTFIQKCQCSLVDPLIDELWSPTKNEKDLVIAAQRTLIQPYDNVVEIAADQAATYCRMATGGKIRTRRLYTNGEEFTMRARRPILMNSTRAIVRAEDLVDRMVFLATNDIELGAARKEDDVLAAEFAAARPKLLGALLAAVVVGLQHRHDPPPANLPRMADFASWCSRCETGFGWEPGTVLAAYRRNIREAARLTAELDLVASAVIAFMEPRTEWKGTATELLRELRLKVGDRVTFRNEWPQTPNWLSHRLRELRPLLRRNDIDVAAQRSGAGSPRSIALTRLIAVQAKPPEAPSTPAPGENLKRKRVRL